MNEEERKCLNDCGFANVTQLLLAYVSLQQENARLKELEQRLIFIKNRVKQGMSQENINKCAIELVNSYLKEN